MKDALMKRWSLKWLACTVLATPLVFSAAAQAAEPLPVVASFSILGDLVQVVGGERVKVSTLVGPDADAHEFEPKPADAKAVLNARLFVINGLHFEPWGPKLAKSAGYKGETLVASKGVKVRSQAAEKGHADTDPHAWQDPSNVVLYVRNIAAALTQLDPAGAATFKTNADAYVKELEALDAWAKTELAPLTPTQRQVITSHDAFGYFAARYQIKFLAPQGVAPEGEPSARAVAQLIKQIQRDKIKAVFVENMSNPKLLAQISKDTGVTLGPKLYVDALSGPTEPGATYLKMMHHNVTQLLAGMRLNQ
jgi:zinc/manganese transport system substrate-binding protein